VFASLIETVAKAKGVSVERAAELLYAEGVRGFDTGYNDKNLARYAATVLKPVNLYAGIRFDAPDGGTAQGARILESAERFGVSRIMCVPNDFPGGVESEDEYAKMRDGLAQFVANAKEKGITVMIEDVGRTANPCSQVKYLKRFLQDIPDLMFTVDSGNLYYAGRGEDIREMVDFAKDRIAHVHIKDQTKENCRRYATVGLGAVPNADVVRTVAKRGYNGWYTIENPVGADHFADTLRQMAVIRYWCGGGR
jgi:sugar phosphate isomerase/epimerase